MFLITVLKLILQEKFFAHVCWCLAEIVQGTSNCWSWSASAKEKVTAHMMPFWRRQVVQQCSLIVCFMTHTHTLK